MLSKNAMVAIRDIVDNATYSKTRLVLKTNAFMGAAVRASALPSNHPLYNGGVPTMSIETEVGAKEVKLSEMEQALYNFAMQDDTPISNTHEAEISAIVEEVTRRVSASLDFASNVINPILRELSQKVTEVRSYYVGSKIAETRIQLLNISPIYESPALETIYKAHSMFGENAALDPVLVSLITKDLTTDAIISVCKTGLSELDGKIESFLRKECEDLVTALRTSPSSVLNAEYVYGPMNVNPFNNHGALVAYLYLNGVLSNRKADIAIDETEASLRNTIAGRRNYFAKCIETQLGLARQALNAGTISVPRYNRPSAGIYAVNANVYRKWIKDNEAASAGAYVAFADSGVSNEDDLINNLDIYVNKWNAMEASAQRKNAAEADNETNRVIHIYLAGVIANDENIDVSTKADMQVRLNDRMKNKRYYSSLELDEYLLNAVCSVLGKGTDAYEILTIMRGEMKDDENLSVQGAAGLASIQILANWAAAQMEWEKV